MIPKNYLKKCLFLLGFVFVINALLITHYTLAEVKRCRGQMVYVPIYSHIYHGDREEHPLDLTATLSIRNTDPDSPITITSINYYGSEGKLLKGYLQNHLKLNPLTSTRVIIQESDKSGGSGASFIVTWESKSNVTAPLIEAIMIGTKGQQGVSFTSHGQVIKETD
ncbi:MAG: DUF3124 domain-containing protein [Thermodesulfobacteriota bacterium]|jgi:hypothetical protein|nr:MAG: DUF3124 domain-containing protein [Thermodesulfobacteriota bacterium]